MIFSFLPGIQVQVLLVDIRLAFHLFAHAALPFLLHLPWRTSEDLQLAHGLYHPGKIYFPNFAVLFTYLFVF